MLSSVPAGYRKGAALRLLSLSPHYFYPEEDGMAGLQLEHERLRESRRRLAELVVAPHTRPSAVVLDFGCGPGYLSRELAGLASEVVGVDISPGALACAQVINPAPNVRYALARGRLPVPDASADLVCSFAVVQHMSEAAFQDALREFARILKPDGTVLCHVPVDKPGWTAEDEWRADSSLRGRLKLRYALNCFGRSREQVARAIRAAYFTDPAVSMIGDFGDVADADLTRQELFVFKKPETR